MKAVTRRPTLLVVDDDPDIRCVVAVLFEALGYEVDTIADGIEALDGKGRHDVTLLDLNMPVFDGEKLADYWLLTDPGRLRRVILLSGHSRYTQGRAVPCFARMPKPFVPEELVAVVERCRQAAQDAEAAGVEARDVRSLDAPSRSRTG